MRGVWRRSVGWVGIAAMLFAQLAISVYACPSAPGLERPGVSTPEVPRDPLDGAATNLCREHCQADARTLDQSMPLFAFDAFVPAFTATISTLPDSLRSAALEGPGLLRVVSPPLEIRDRRLRI